MNAGLWTRKDGIAHAMMLRASTLETGTRPREPLSRLFVLSVVTVAVLLAAAPVIVTSALRILGVESTTPIEWVPESFAPRRAYDQFTREFESGDVVVASWPGCTVGAPAIDRFVEAATGSKAPTARSAARRSPAQQRWRR